MQRTGTLLGGRYELGPVVGAGGMATVYGARDRQLGREVAVKVLAANLGADHAFVERFRREARAAAGLAHPNLVTVYDTGSEGDTHYLVMELVEGETLDARLRRTGALPAATAVEIALGVCRALEVAHERGLVHRDVKPGNVMLGEDGRVRLVDLGIARVGGLDALTTTGTVLGSSAYLSPEQASGEPGDARSDVYALGCVLYEMLSGRPPFVTTTSVATLYLHVTEVPEPPSAIRPVPAALESIVLRCLEKEPSRRFASAREVEAALLSVGGGGDTMPLPATGLLADTAPVPGRVIRATATTGHRRRGRPWWLAAAGLGLVLLLATGVALGSDPFRPRAELRRAAAAAEEAPPAPSPDVRTAWVRMRDAIALGVAEGEIEPEVGRELSEAAEAIRAAYERSDAAATSAALVRFQDELTRGIEGGAISPESAAAIERATLDLLGALRREGALAVAEATPESPDPTHVEGSDGSDTENDHGPPPHAQAKGHDGD